MPNDNAIEYSDRLLADMIAMQRNGALNELAKCQGALATVQQELMAVRKERDDLAARLKSLEDSSEPVQKT